MASIQTAIQLADRVSGPMLQIMNSVNRTITAFEEMQRASSAPADMSWVDGTRQEINEAAASLISFREEAEKLTKTQAQPPIEAPIRPVWVSQPTMPVFDTTGLERVQQETRALNQMLDTIRGNQQQIGEQANGIVLLPAQAREEIGRINQRMTETLQKMEELQSVDPAKLDEASLGRYNNELESTRGGMLSLLNLQKQLNEAAQTGDISGLNAGYNQLDSQLVGVEQKTRQIKETIREPVEIPVEWDTSGNLEVFTNSGVERFRQEIQAVTDSLDMMTASQSNVVRMAQQMDLPPGMLNDMISMNSRIQMIQASIRTLEANPIDNIGADAANNQLEQLRRQLAQATATQKELTAAMGRGDLSAVLTQYNQLNGTVSQTERQLRDNIMEQKDFNQEIRNGGKESDSLLGKLSRVVAVLGVGTAAKSLFTGMFGAAAELEATEAKYNTVFNGMQTKADQFIQEFQKLTPATTAEARSMASGIQDLLVPMGMQRGAATEMTGDMMHLIGALTNFNSATKSTEDVAGAFSSALTGEYDSLKSLGIQVNDTIVKQKAVSMGLAKSEKNVSAVAKAQAMYALACEQSGDALAAYNEESLDTTTRLGLLKAGFQDSLGEAGQILLPKINELLQKVQEHMPEINQAIQGLASAFGIVVDAASWLFDAVMNIGQWIGDNWSAIEPILLGIAAALGVVALATGIHAAVTAVQTAATWLSVAANRDLVAAMLKNPVIWIALAIGALVAIIYKWVQSVGGIKIAWLIAMDKIQTAWDWVKIGLTTGVYWIMDKFNQFQLMFMTVSTNVQNFIGDMKAGALQILQDMVNGAIDIINNFIDLLNKIPGVSIESIDHVTFGAEYAAANEAEKAERNAALADYRNKIEQQISDRAADLEQRKADARAATEERQQEILQAREELAKKQAETEDNTPEVPPDPYTSTIASDVGVMKDSMEISQEDLKYLREIADRESINRFTTAEIKVDMQNTNQLSSNMDIDGFINHFGEQMEETLASVAVAYSG